LTEVYARASGLDRDRLETWIRIRALVFAGELAEVDGDRGRRQRVLRVADAIA
jgi:hypothetical protein